MREREIASEHKKVTELRRCTGKPAVLVFEGEREVLVVVFLVAVFAGTFLHRYGEVAVDFDFRFRALNAVYEAVTGGLVRSCCSSANAWTTMFALDSVFRASSEFAQNVFRRLNGFVLG